MNPLRLFLFACLVAAAAVLPVFVNAQASPPAIASVSSAANYQSVDVTFTQNAFTNADGTGDLGTSDFTVTANGSAVPFTVARTTNGADRTGWRLTFTAAITPHTTSISTVANQIYTAAPSTAFPAETTAAPFNTNDLTAFLSGLKNVPVVPAEAPEIPFVADWFGTAQSLPQMVAGLSDLTVAGTEAQLITALKGLGATTPGTGYISDVTFNGTKATITLNPSKIASTRTISVEGGVEEIGTTPFALSLEGNASVSAALGGTVALDVASGSATLDTASAPQLKLTSNATFTPSGRLGVVEITAPDTVLNLNATLTAGLTCETGPCTIAQHMPTLTTGGTAELLVTQVDVAFGTTTQTFERDNPALALLELDWANLANPDNVTATTDKLSELKLRDFTRVSANEIAGGVQWVATWLTELEKYGAMTDDLPVVGGTMGEVGGLSKSLAEPAVALAQVLGAVGDISAQDLTSICEATTYEPLIDALEFLGDDGEPLTGSALTAKRTELKTSAAAAAGFCDELLEEIAYDATANAITYNIGFTVDEDLFNEAAPTLNLGLGELEGIQVTGRSGTWTGDATVTFDMTFGVKLGSATDLGIASGVSTGDYDGDTIADASDPDEDGDNVPQAYSLTTGDRCNALAGFLGVAPASITPTSGTEAANIAACDAKLAVGTTVDGNTLDAAEVCEAVADIHGVEPAAFRTLNSLADNAACATAVQAGGDDGPYSWDGTKALGTAAQLPHRIYIAADTNVAEVALDIDGTGIGASANIAILDLEVDGDLSIEPTAEFGFTDPSTSGVKDDDKIDLFEMARKADAANAANNPALLADLVDMDFGGPIDAHLALTNEVLFPGAPKGIDVVGDLSAIDNGDADDVFEFHTTRLEDATGLDADMIHVGHDLGDFLNLKDITPAQALQMIIGIVEQLSEMGESGVMSQTIPFVDVTPAQMVDFTKDFAEVAARVEARDPQDISTLQDALNEALGSVGMPTDVIQVGVTATELTVEFNASQSVTRSYPFTFEGADLAFAPADGGASVQATAAMNFQPIVGINFDAGTTANPIDLEDRLFVRNITPSFDVDLDANIYGGVYLGPLGASLTGDATVGDTDADAHELELIVNGTDSSGAISLADLKDQLASPSTGFDLTYSGPVSASLAVTAQLPTGGRGTGTLDITGDLANPSAFVIEKDFDFDLGLDIGTFVNGSIQAARFMGRSLEQSEAVTSELPLIGNDLKELVTVGADMRAGADELEALWNEVNAETDGRNNFVQQAEDELDAVLCPSIADGCTTMTLFNGDEETQTFSNATGMELGLTLEQSETRTITLDEGLAMDPVFNMNLAMEPSVSYGYTLDVVLGMNITDGFYVRSSSEGGDILQLFASMSTGTINANVDLLGLSATVDSGDASIAGGLGPDEDQGGFAIKVGGDDGKLTLRELSNRRTKVEDLIQARIDMVVRADLPLDVKVDGLAELRVPIHFEMAAGGDVTALEAPTPVMTLGCEIDHADLPEDFCATSDRVELDISTLVDDVFKPIFGDKFLGNSTYNPLANPDIKAALDDEIPVLDTTLRKLLAATAEATGKQNEFKLITMLIDISNVDIDSMTGQIDLGWAKVTPGWTYYEPDVPIAQQDVMAPLYQMVNSVRGSAGTPTGTPSASTEAVTGAQSAASQPGTGTATPTRQPATRRPGTGVRDLAKMISFPIINDPAAAMNLLRGDVGSDIDFVRIEPPPINIGPSINWSKTLFDLDIGFMKGGLTVAFKGNLGLSIDLGFGFDSSGIAQGEAWKGLYIVDYPGPEVALGGAVAGSIDGYFSVAGGIADVRFRGSAGISLLAGIDLFDDSIALPAYSRSDGKMNVGEMQMIDEAYGNPLCMFKLAIQLKANLGFSGSAKVLGITVFNESYSDDWTLVDEVLTCQIRTRVAHMEGRRLVLNGGSFADFRYDGEGDVREDFTLTKDGSEVVVNLTTGGSSVKPALRFPIADIDEIYGELGANENSVSIAPEIELPSTIFGGPNVDTLTGGGGVDTFDGAAGNDILKGRGNADSLAGGEGNDTLEGGAGDDVTAGGDGTNTYEYGDSWGSDELDDAGADATLKFTGANALTGEARFEDGTVTATGGELHYDMETVSRVLGGSGNDTFTFNNYTPEGFSFDGRGGGDQATFKTSGIERAVSVTDTGSSGNDEVRVLGTRADDTFLLRANGSGEGPATSGFVALKTPTDLVERVSYDNSIEDLNVRGDTGNNRFVLDDTATDLTLDTGDGDNEVQVGQIFANERTAANASGGAFRTRGVEGRGHLSYGISHDATINGGDGQDFMTVYSNTAPLNLNGGDGDDTFVVRAFIAEGTVEAAGGDGNDRFDYVQNELVTIDGGGGFNTFVAVGTELSDGWHVTSDGIRICPLEDAPSGSLVPRLPGDTDCGINVVYTNIQSLVAHGLNGNDVFWIGSTGTGVHTQLFGGTDGATFYANDSTSGVSNIDGPLTIKGDFDPNFDSSVADPVTLPGEDDTPGTEPTLATYDNQVDKLIVDAAPHTGTDTGNLTSERLSGLGMGSGETIDVATAAGSRTFPTGIVYDQIDELVTQLGSGADTFTIASTHTYETGGNDSSTVATETTLLGGPGADNLYVRTIDGPTTVNGQAGNDTVEAGSLAPAANGRANLLADLLTVAGGDGDNDRLFLDDTAAITDTTSIVKHDSIRGLGMAEGIDYGTLEVLDLDLGSGGDVVNVRGTAAATTVHGRNGDEDYYVASRADLTGTDRVDGLTENQIEDNLLAGHLDDVDGTLSFDAGAGQHLLMVSDRATATGDSAVAMTSRAIAGLAPKPITYNASGTFKRGITVWTSDEADTVGVTSTRSDAGVRTGTTLNTGAGADAVTATLTATNGPFATNLENGDDTFTGSGSALGLVVFGGNGQDGITTGTGSDLAFGDKAIATYGADATVIGHGGTGDVTDGAIAALSTLTSTDLCAGDADTVNLGTGNDVAYGGAGDDQLRGEAGSDSLLGDHGQHDATWTAPTHRSLDADAAASCFGNDTLLGGADNDLLLGQGGTDTVYGSGIVGNLTNSGATGTNVIVGGHDVAGGMDSDDVLVGGGATDTIIGDNGVVSAANVVTVHDLGCAGAGCDDVAGNDILRTLGGTDRLFGGVGDDYAVGGTGYDRMEGGPGDDWLEGGTGDDDIVGGSSQASSGTEGFADGNDVVFGTAGADVVLADNGQISRTAGGTTTGEAFLTPATFTTTGTYLTATHRSVRLYDLAHTVAANEGDDVVAAGTGASFVFGQGGDDWISGGTGDDYAEGNAGNDVLMGDRQWGLALNNAEDAVTSSLAALPTLADSTFPGVAASLLELRSNDVQTPTALNVIEGTTGSAGQDDLIGGSSITAQPSGNDIVYGDDADDVAYGDNARITREIMTSGADARLNTTPYDGIAAPAYARHDERYPSNAVLPAGATVVRKVVEHNVGASVSAGVLTAGNEPYGDDFVDGGKGNDSVAGQDGGDVLWGGPAGESAAGWGDYLTGGLGDDKLFGGGGHDVLIGDRGSVFTQYLDASGDSRDPAAFSYKSKGAPYLTFDVFSATSKVAARGKHWHRVDLYCAATRPVPSSGRTSPAFVAYGSTGTTCPAGGSDATADTTGLAFTKAVYGGVDVARGGPGEDAIYGGAGDDRLNGDRGADRVFGGLGSDVIWGGMGDPNDPTDTQNLAVDLLFGGAGEDFLDYRPRVIQSAAGQNGWTDRSIRHDPHTWFEATDAYAHPDAPATPVESAPQHHQGVSWMYGGLDRDGMQASVTANGPNPGTRMLDWNGLYNLYTQCSPNYGGYNVIRTLNSSTQTFVQDIAFAAGASPSRAATVRGQSAGDQVGFATTKDAQTGDPYTDAHIGGVPGSDYGDFIDCS